MPRSGRRRQGNETARLRRANADKVGPGNANADKVGPGKEN